MANPQTLHSTKDQEEVSAKASLLDPTSYPYPIHLSNLEIPKTDQN